MDSGIKCKMFTYKSRDSEKFSVLEMMLSNVKGVLKKERIKTILYRILRNDKTVFDVVALAVYLSSCDSALSTDILFTYFDLKSYTEVEQLIESANGFLASEHIVVESDDDDQDYFTIRSNLFLYHSSALLREDSELKKYYAGTVLYFTENVSPYIIYQYNQFRRKAYDSELFYNLFGDEANDLYSYIYEYDKNPYTLQQWALYRSKLRDFKQAFVYIDKAIQRVPYNFSMKNSRAIILFEANRNEFNRLATEKLREAMIILEECYTNDKRKVYHAQKYAEFAIHFATERYDKQYLDRALKWIQEVIYRGDSNSRKTLYYMDRLNRLRR